MASTTTASTATDMLDHDTREEAIEEMGIDGKGKESFFQVTFCFFYLAAKMDGA